MSWYNKGLSISPKNENILNSKADILFSMGNYQEAQKIYENIYNNDKFSLSSLNKIVKCFIQRNKQKEAVAYLNDLLCQEESKKYTPPNFKKTIYSLLLSINQNEKVLIFINSCFEANPDQINILELKMEYLQKNEKFIKAIEVADQILRINPKIISTYIHKCDCCLLYTSPSPRDLSTSRMPSSA